MLLDLEAHKELNTEIDSDNSCQGEVPLAAPVLQADLLGLILPTDNASTSEVCKHCSAYLKHWHQLHLTALVCGCRSLQASKQWPLSPTGTDHLLVQSSNAHVLEYSMH